MDCIQNRYLSRPSFRKSSALVKSEMNLINACFILLVVVGLLDFNLVSAQRHRGGKMTKRFINSIIKLHNEYRRGEGASNMKQLVSS